jgi:hypothetical protein
MGAAARGNPAAPAGVSAGEAAGKVWELTNARFGAEEGGGAAPASGLGGTGRRRSLRARFRRGRGRPVTTRGAGGSSEG